MAVHTGILPPRYHSPERIGSGGMSDIFLANDEVLQRRVAVKVLAERYARDEGIRKRFTREARAAARLAGEPGAVTIFDVGEWEERPYIVMEFVPGGSLDDRIRRSGAHPPAQVLRWLEQAAAALDAAHAHGIVHRDVKPANLLLDSRENVMVADFGIASAAGLDSLTLTGTVLGTAGYLSPEQARGEKAGPASDRYALAVVAYELLSGERPYANDSVTAEAAAHVNSPVPSIAERCRNLPREVDPVFQRALAKDPAARYGTAADFVADLREALARAAGTTGRIPVVAPAAHPAARRRRSLAIPAALLLAAGAAGAVTAALVTGGGNNKAAERIVTRRVTGPAGQVKTVRETVTRQQTVTAPAAPPPPPPPTPAAGDGRSLNDRGYQLIQQGNFAGAVPLLQQAVRKLAGTGPGDPYEAYANYNLGYALYRSGRCSEAVPYLRRAEQLEPNRSEPGDIRRRAERC
jgi:tRNA A-37 threonylcarbamoyl transferase component Bud32